MGKHDWTHQLKRKRNRVYALRYQQLVCKICGHRSSKKGSCPACRAEPKQRKPRKRIF